MRAIQKGREPQSLTRHKRSPHANYDNYPQKDELRTSLVTEQGGICCYCMQRIRPEVGGMKIEHWHCQALYPDEQLDYGNLIGACMGNEREPREKQHCDTYKGNVELSRNPADPIHRVEDYIQYPGNGRIVSPNGQLNQELNAVLNLNHSFLINNRKAVLDALKERLRRGTLSGPALQRMISDWSEASGDRLRPFCGVVVYWLRKRLARV